jgi:YD repeat-containing protein
MRLSRFASTPVACSLSLLLSYTLFITLCCPLSIHEVKAASPRREEVSADVTVSPRARAVVAGRDNHLSSVERRNDKSTIAPGSDMRRDAGVRAAGPERTSNVQQGERFRVPPPTPVTGVPSSNLPDLDEVRNRQHQSPRTPAPVPSTRCAPRRGNCGRTTRPQTEQAVDPIISGATAAQSQSVPVGLLAARHDFQTIESLLGISSVAVSDSPFLVKVSERMVAGLSSPLLAPTLQSSSTQNVVWTGGQGVTVTGNTLTKTAASGWGNAGAISTKAIASGNGYMEFTALRTDESMVAGLSHGDDDQNWTDIDYGIDAASNGLVYICESGVCRSGFGSYSAGTRFRVAIEGGLVKYYRGTTLLDSHSVTPTYPLLVDSALWDINGKLSDVTISGLLTNPPALENVIWTNKSGVASSGNTLTKIAASGWGNAGAISTRAISAGDGYMTFKANSTSQSIIAGLSHGDANQNYTDIDYGIDAASNGLVYICESGVCRSGFGSYTTEDIFKVAIEGGLVKYYKGTTLLDSHSASPVYPLNVDCALWDQSGLLKDVKLYGALQYADGYTPPENIDFSTPRVDPINRTGTGGEDLLSGNYNWSVPLVSLPGRAGLDLGLSLSYNSLVWTRSGSYITYDADHGFPSPGFRLGFPVIQPLFTNTQTGKAAYLLLAPSGARVELRQTDANPAIYESSDSSYLRLDTTQMLLWTTDGTQFSYEYKGDAYQCTRIRDRNGNLINVSYDQSTGQITEIKDTLARILNFVYDGNQNLLKITQQRSASGPAHNIATFGYNSDYAYHTNFYVGGGDNSQLTMIGMQDNTPFPVLEMVGLEDGSYFKFTYSTWGQVSRITRYASDSNPAQDNHALSYVSYNLANDTTARTNCPRFTERRNWAENWNGGAEAVTTFSIALNGNEGTVTLPKVTYKTSGQPDTDIVVINKEYFGAGVQKGLTTKVETYANNSLVRTSQTTWTQDRKTDGSEYAYQVNPRPTSTIITDPEGNNSGTTIDYDSYAAYGLPHVVKECKFVGTTCTPLRETVTEYKMDQAYLDKRIIGLITERRVREGQVDKSKTVYAYDAGGEQLIAPTANNVQVEASQHDPGYNTSFLLRGNVTSVSRYDVVATGNPALTTQLGYDTGGSLVFSRDPQGHKTEIGYADSFSDNVNRNTFAYPTSVKDADAYQSFMKYDYYTGVVTYRKDPKGAEFLATYDAAGRVDRTSNSVNGAFRQFAYGPNYVVTWDSVQSIAQTLYAISVFDGAGRVIKAAKDAPVPGAGENRYSAKQFIYDVMGRVEFQSNPTEIGPGWVASGDDALQANGQGGWRYSQQTYDWKGRPRLTVNTDGTTQEATYGGCGCAGGETITLRDEVGRTQKSYADTLGRVVKVEELNQDANQSKYRTTTTLYNALDQPTRVRQYAGEAPLPEPEIEESGYRTTTIEYDGYGRLWKKKLPQQDSPSIYSYYADDLVHTVTDARGAVATYSYNNRHLLTGVAYRLTGSPNIDVAYGYDEAGNRTSMSDGLGSTTYSYNALSRMESETRFFNGVGTFSLSYSYNLAGEVTSVTDPFGSVSYDQDYTGRTTGVTGTNFGSTSQLASDLLYRAWGAVKSLSYGNHLSLSIGYNRRLLPDSFQLSGRPAQYGPSTVMQSSYDYYGDGSIRYAHDVLDERFDRAYSYDTGGYLHEAYSGSEARDFINQTQSGTVTGPYRQSYQFNVWGDLTSKGDRYWSHTDSYLASYANARNPLWTYDEDGRIKYDGSISYGYDAAGRNISITSGQMTTTQAHDGDGQVVKRVYFDDYSATWMTGYYLRSSVMGGKVIAEITPAGQRRRRYAHLGADVLAKQEGNTLSWRHENPLTGSRGSSDTTGQYAAEAEFDPTGVSLGFSDPYVEPSGPIEFPQEDGVFSLLPDDPSGRCRLDGFAMPCAMVLGMRERGSAMDAPVDQITTMRFRNQITGEVRYTLGIFGPLPDGGAGFVPAGAHFDEGNFFTVGLGMTTESGPALGIGRAVNITGGERYDSLGHAREQQRRQVVPLPDLRKGLETLLKKGNGDCGRYVQKLLDTAAALFPQNPLQGKTVMELFEKISKQGNYQTDARFSNTVSGDLSNTDGRDPATVHLLPWNTYGPPTAYQIDSANRNYIYGALHETLHLAAKGWLLDYQLAKAAYSIAGKKLPDTPISDHKKWSSRFDDELMVHCPK